MKRLEVAPETARQAFDLLKPRVEGADPVLVRSLDEPEVGETIQAFVPGVQKVAARSANRVAQAKKMRRLSFAFHNYHDLHKTLPPVAAELRVRRKESGD